MPSLVLISWPIQTCPCPCYHRIQLEMKLLELSWAASVVYCVVWVGTNRDGNIQDE